MSSLPVSFSCSDSDEDEGGPENGLCSNDATADFTWRADPPAVPQPGLTRFATARMTVIESTWNLLIIIEKIIQEILSNTNLDMLQTPNTALEHVEETELKAFRGFLLLAGVCRSNK